LRKILLKITFIAFWIRPGEKIAHTAKRFRRVTILRRPSWKELEKGKRHIRKELLLCVYKLQISRGRLLGKKRAGGEKKIRKKPRNQANRNTDAFDNTIKTEKEKGSSKLRHPQEGKDGKGKFNAQGAEPELREN